MSAKGHTIQMGIREEGHAVRITLECTCGSVFKAGEFVVDDLKHRQIVRDEGHAAAKEHLAAVMLGGQS